jgi:hypothetical protein
MEVTPDEVRTANSSDIQVIRSWKWTKSGVSKNGAQQVVFHVPFTKPIAIIAFGSAIYFEVLLRLLIVVGRLKIVSSSWITK